MGASSSSTTWPCAAVHRAPLAPRTTMRIGGEAEWLLEPATPEELREAWCAALERGYAPRVLGGGANLLIEDGLHRGVVLTTDRMARTFRPGAAHTPEEDAAQRASGIEREPVLVAWAGAPMPRLCRTARELALTGLEGLAGVPGHIGGGIAMNAGGRWGELWDVVESVRVMTPGGEEQELERDDCSPGYRDGGLGERIVLSAVLRLAPDDPQAVRERVRGFLAEKNQAQPVSEHSSGCMFRNPDPELSDGRGAGQLIDDCGGKGLSRGDAVVSPKHGNFIVNRGSARAEDVLGLMGDVRRLVRDRTGIELITEVRIWHRPSAEGPAGPDDA
ncbi:MAG: UDP-N-acetylmuramate dehydrogenase [Planctomycetota bacterium]